MQAKPVLVGGTATYFVKMSSSPKFYAFLKPYFQTKIALKSALNNTIFNNYPLCAKQSEHRFLPQFYYLQALHIVNLTIF